MGAIILHALHRQLTHEEAGGYPVGHWLVTNSGSIGQSGRADLSLVWRSQIRGPAEHGSRQPAAVFEGKTYHVCKSRGDSVDGTLMQSMPVLSHLSEWMDGCNGVIPIDPPGTSASSRPKGDINWYLEPWQKKIQKFFFQVCAV
jgi:hypothetical protein